VKYQPNRNYRSCDDVQTPIALARALVEHYAPTGRILEPCAGEGNFLRVLPKGTLWCEIKRGRDFFDFHEKIDWIITNPPWSKMRAFLRHSMELADHVCFLMTINHLWTQARLRDITKAGFGIREIILLDMPPEFPPSGFQLGSIHLQRGYRGPIHLVDWRKEQ